MIFGNPIVGDEDLIRSGIRSPGYVAGVSGWRIAQDGSAEFNNVTVRGTLAAGSITGDLVLAGGRFLSDTVNPRWIIDTSSTGGLGSNPTIRGIASSGAESGRFESRAAGLGLIYNTGGIHDFNAGGVHIGDGLRVGSGGGGIPPPAGQIATSGTVSCGADVVINQLANLYLRGIDPAHRIVVPAVASAFSTTFAVDGPCVVGYNNWIFVTGNNAHWQAAVWANGFSVFGQVSIGNGATNDYQVDPETLTLYGGTTGVSMRQRTRAWNDGFARQVIYPNNDAMYFWSQNGGDMMRLAAGGNCHFPMGLPILGGIGMIYATGSGQIGTVASGAHFKENVRDLGGDADNPVFALRPRRFSWKADSLANAAEYNERVPGGFAGLIAQEVNEVAPDAIHVDAGGEPCALDERVLIAYLVDAVQYLRRELRK